MHKSNQQNGFTLVETIIYLAIMAIVMTSFLYFGSAIFDYRHKVYAVQEVQANERMAINFLSQKIREAKDVNIGQSIFNTDPGVLSLTMDDSNRNPTIISLNQDDGVLQITEGIFAPVAITSENVKIKNLVFTNLSSQSIKNIKFNLTVEYSHGQNSKDSYSNDLEIAVSLRR